MKLPLFTQFWTFVGFAILIVLGKVRDLFARRSARSDKHLAPLLRDFEAFYIRRLYKRIADAWNRPIASAPDAHVTVALRDTVTLQRTGETRDCINLGSYNYLGFGDPKSPCVDAVVQTLRQHGVSACSKMHGLGRSVEARALECELAEFVGKEDALVFSMGFGVNFSGIPSLVGPGCLVISDQFNHNSIVNGVRASGAKVRVFKHNDAADLERVVRDAIVQGQPRTHRAWRKIVIVVEGVYSMEGHTACLRDIVRIKKKYRCSLYLDEAHSIGCIGETGRGACEQCGVSPADVDVMMGTFTKSFGAVGGYIAGDADLVRRLRARSAGSLYSFGLNLPCIRQVREALASLHTPAGLERIRRIKENADYFRNELRRAGAQVLGEDGSPVVPLMLGNPAKIIAFSREALDRGLAVVVVGFPATPILAARTRFCISAAHTREDLKQALVHIDDILGKLHLRYGSS
ncbi:MAG: hypothetical protein MHM6MM_003654 [Cercozoa sp. M6MM]